MLVESYRSVKSSIVAFVAKYSHDPRNAEPGQFPLILGTGFIVHEDGLIITNDHVVEQFAKCPRPDGIDELAAVKGLMFHQNGHMMSAPVLDVLRVARIKNYEPIDSYWDRKKLDLAIVGVGLKGLPACTVRLAEGGIEEGMEVATAGFPMGTDALVDFDQQLRQLCPVLQRGIISSLHPFAVSDPLSFTINILLQNGASGSPVFDVKTGEVLGVAYQRKFERSVSPVVCEDGKIVQTAEGKKLRALINLPTNLSHVVPTYRLGNSLNGLRDIALGGLENKQITLNDYLRSMNQVDMITGTVTKALDLADDDSVIVRRVSGD